MRVYPYKTNSPGFVDRLSRIGCDKRAYDIFLNKRDIIPVLITDVKVSIANIIKQEMLSSKGDAVVHRDVICGTVPESSVLLLGTFSHYKDFIRKIKSQGYPSLIGIAEEMEGIIEISRRNIDIIKYPNKVNLDFRRPLLMGILNVTDDSFYDGGQHFSTENALMHATSLVDEGADIIDVGGESTRPGADALSKDEELDRVLPIVEALAKSLDTVISVDTYKAEVAEACLKAGAHLINDISGLTFDSRMGQVIAEYGCPVVIMHIKGTPHDMQKEPAYDDVIVELMEYFEERIEYARSQGIQKESIIIDPGIGFGKRAEDNKAIIRDLSVFKKFGVPILVGASRKSMVGEILNKPVDERLYGTLGVHSLAYLNGASILRVHDVQPHRDMLNVISAISL